MILSCCSWFYQCSYWSLSLHFPISILRCLIIRRISICRYNSEFILYSILRINRISMIRDRTLHILSHTSIHIRNILPSVLRVNIYFHSTLVDDLLVEHLLLIKALIHDWFKGQRLFILPAYLLFLVGSFVFFVVVFLFLRIVCSILLIVLLAKLPVVVELLVDTDPAFNWLASRLYFWKVLVRSLHDSVQAFVLDGLLAAIS